MKLCVIITHWPHGLYYINICCVFHLSVDAFWWKRNWGFFFSFFIPCFEFVEIIFFFSFLFLVGKKRSPWGNWVLTKQQTMLSFLLWCNLTSIMWYQGGKNSVANPQYEETKAEYQSSPGNMSTYRPTPALMECNFAEGRGETEPKYWK